MIEVLFKQFADTTKPNEIFGFIKIKDPNLPLSLSNVDQFEFSVEELSKIHALPTFEQQEILAKEIAATKVLT